MSETNRMQRFSGFEKDDIILLGIVAVIQIGGYLAYQYIGPLPNFPEERASSPMMGGFAGIILVVESIILVVLYKGWKRIPGLLRKVIKYGCGIGAYVFILYAAISNGEWWMIYLTIGLLCFVGIDHLLNKVMLDWITWNIFVLVIGLCGVVYAAKLLDPSLILVFLGVTMVWDRYAVDFSSWMKEIINFSVDSGIPNHFVIPDGWRMDWEQFTDWLKADDADKPDDVSFVIGLGDFVLPGMLAISAGTIESSASLYPLVGVFVGTCIAMARVRYVARKRESGVPALPWLNTGAIVGFFAGVLISGAPMLVALGVSSA